MIERKETGIYNCNGLPGVLTMESVLEECKVRDVDFREAVLCGAKCCGSDFSNSLFGKTNLSGADFTAAGSPEPSVTA